MAYMFSANAQFAADYLDANGEHIRLPRSVDLPSGQNVSIGDFFNKGIPPPQELIDDLPQIVRLYRLPVVSAGYVGGRDCFILDEGACSLLRRFSSPFWSHPAHVTYSGIPPLNKKWFFVAFPMLQREEMIIDLQKSKNWVWKEVAGPLGTRRYLGTTLPKKFMPVLFADQLNDLTIWRGVGGGQLSSLHFCCDDFKSAWEAEGLTGLHFDHVPESERE